MSTREDFEAWADGKGFVLGEDYPGSYWNVSTATAWESWQAATSRQDAKIKALEQAIAQEQPNQCDTCGWRRAGMVEAGLVDSQYANTNPVVSQKTAETVDKDCGNCKKFSTNSLTGGPVCISCKDYSNWEPKP